MQMYDSPTDTQKTAKAYYFVVPRDKYDCI